MNRVPYWADTPPTWQPTEGDYYASTAVGSSALALFARDREAFHRGDKMEMTDAMLRGRVVDCAITEPGKFAERYFCDTKTTRSAWQWGYILPSCGPVPKDVWKQATTAVGALERNTLAMDLLRHGPGLSQVCHKWTHPSGVECRMRLDRATDAAGVDGDGRPIRRPVIVDLKSLDIAQDRIDDEVYKWGIHRQMALYSQGFEDLWGAVPAVVLTVVPPSGAWVESKPLSRKFLELGRLDVDADLHAMAECRQTGDWSNPRGKTLKEACPSRWAVIESERRHGS